MRTPRSISIFSLNCRGLGRADDGDEKLEGPLTSMRRQAVFAAALPAVFTADLRLNELGHFLGGVSSPLAFLWLVLGFFQQSREIRLSNQALHLQAREMRRSVDEHRRIAGGE